MSLGRRGRQGKPLDSGPGERRSRLQEAERKIDQALEFAKGEVGPRTGREYRKVLLDLLNSLSDEALRLHCEHVTECRFYASFDDLMSSFFRKFPAAKSEIKGTLKGVFDRDGVLHLNGGGLLFGRDATLREFFAHEVTHSIDGVNHEISDSESWREAWASELTAGRLLGMASSRSQREGFAEFGRILLGTENMIQELARRMPKSLSG